MFSLFASPSYQGSALERLINANPALTIQFSKESVETFGGALAKEYPRPLGLLLQTTNRNSQFDDKLNDLANEAFPLGIASQTLLLSMSASGMAQYYGSQIDQLKMTNAGAAFALGSALAEYVNACSVPAANCDAGYRRHLSAYLILRDRWSRLASWGHGNSGWLLSKPTRRRRSRYCSAQTRRAGDDHLQDLRAEIRATRLEPGPATTQQR